jgi:hypothetical protein
LRRVSRKGAKDAKRKQPEQPDIPNSVSSLGFSFLPLRSLRLGERLGALHVAFGFVDSSNGRYRI